MKNRLFSTLAILSILAYSCNKHDDHSSAGTPSLSLSRTALATGISAGYTDTFTVTSTVSWTLDVGADGAAWLQVDTTKGSAGLTTVKVTVISDNNTKDAQTATLTISPVGTTAIKPQVLTVKQTMYNLVWQKSFGGSGFDIGKALIQTADGGYISAGYSLGISSGDGDAAGNHGQQDALIVKMDGNGNKVWAKSYGGTSTDVVSSIAASTDGGYISVGYSSSIDGDVTGNHGNYDFWVVKLDADGKLLWQKSLGGSEDDLARTVINTTDGGYLVSGYTYSNNGDVTGNRGSGDLWVVKLDAGGNLLWQKTFGSSGDDYEGTVAATADGGYILTGIVNGNDGDGTGNHGGEDILVLKMDGSGNKVWAKTLGGTANEEAYSIIAAVDGGYVVTGNTLSNDGDVTGNHGKTDMWVVKLDNNGNKIWQKALGGTNDEYSYSIVAAPDGGYMITGATSSTNGDVTGIHDLAVNGTGDLWAVKLDNKGNKLWQKTLGSSDDDAGFSVISTTDGGFAIGGYSSANDGDVTGNHGQTDMWIVKLK